MSVRSITAAKMREDALVCSKWRLFFILTVVIRPCYRQRARVPPLLIDHNLVVLLSVVYLEIKFSLAR